MVSPIGVIPPAPLRPVRLMVVRPEDPTSDAPVRIVNAACRVAGKAELGRYARSLVCRERQNLASEYSELQIQQQVWVVDVHIGKSEAVLIFVVRTGILSHDWLNRTPSEERVSSRRSLQAHVGKPFGVIVVSPLYVIRP